jgi:hypothetical protein
MKKLLFLLLLTLILISTAYSQFNKPVFQFGMGIVQPYDDMKGTYYREVNLGHTFVITPDTNLYRNNMGGKTGLYFFGKAKINFDKYNIFRAVGGIAYSTFNTFETEKNGNIGVRIVNINNEVDTALVSASYNYNLSNFNFSLGLEVSPLAFTEVFSPFFGADMSFNFFSTHLSRTENHYDSTSFKTNDFRIGFTFNAGIEAKVSKSWGFVVGIKYDLGNVLFKRTDGGYSDAHEWGKSNGTMNDDAGIFYSTLYNPVITADRYQVYAKEKKLNWGTIYIGANFYFNTEKSKKTPPKK